MIKKDIIPDINIPLRVTHCQSSFGSCQPSQKIGLDRILKRVGGFHWPLQTNLNYFVVKISYYLHPSHGSARHNREKCDMLGQERNVPADVG